MSGKVTFHSVTKDNIQQLRTVDKCVFPVQYSDKYYAELISKTESKASSLVRVNGLTVGSLCLRTEPHGKGTVKLYVFTFGLLEPYRGFGFGRQMMDHLLKVAEGNKSVDHIYLMAQVTNLDAITFYEQKGFEKTEVRQKYYNTGHPDAQVLVRKVARSAEEN